MAKAVRSPNEISSQRGPANKPRTQQLRYLKGSEGTKQSKDPLSRHCESPEQRIGKSSFAPKSLYHYINKTLAQH